MKRLFLPLLILSAVLTACTPPQQVVSSWVNREALPKGPYNSIFIMALTQSFSAKITVETELAKAITARGKKAVRSSDIVLPKMSAGEEGSRDALIKAVKQAGCDAVLTVALLDVKSEDRYEPGTTYYPIAHDYYGSFDRYVFYYYEEVTEEGYYVTDNTYYIEGNFYDLASEQILWSVQSDSYNPPSLEKWFSGYAKLLVKQLKKEGVISE